MEAKQNEIPKADYRPPIQGEIMCVSNLLRRKFENSDAKKTVDSVTNMHGYIIGFLYRNRHRDIFQKDIEEAFSYRRSTASSVVGLMEEKGLIVRLTVPNDARLKKIVLTERALEFIQILDEDRARTESQISEGIDEEEMKVFFSVLGKIKNNLVFQDGGKGAEEIPPVPFKNNKGGIKQ